MNGMLQGKSLVIVGGTAGIGFSAAKAFLAAGARVVIVGREQEKVDAAIQELGGRALGLAGDATDPQCALAAIRVAVGNFGTLHGLYHVAGGSGRRLGDGPLDTLTDEGWDFTLRLNLTSVFYSNRAAVQQFLKQGGGGSVVNVSSVLAFSPSPRHFGTHAYAAAKAAIVGLTQSAASTYAVQNIRFNVLAPALVATAMSQRAQKDERLMQYIQTKQPLDGGRISQPEDLDAAAVFLLSDAARFVTGQVLAVDGGWSVTEGQMPGAEAPVRRPAESHPTEASPTLWHTMGRIWGKTQRKK